MRNTRRADSDDAIESDRYPDALDDRRAEGDSVTRTPWRMSS